MLSPCLWRLARIIHEGFDCNYIYVAASSLTMSGLATWSVDILFQACSLPHGSAHRMSSLIGASVPCPRLPLQFSAFVCGQFYLAVHRQEGISIYTLQSTSPSGCREYSETRSVDWTAGAPLVYQLVA
jgi:hypothetical protein